MDSHELNEYADVFNENADICVAKLQEWHQQGMNVAITKSISSSIAPGVTVAILNCDDQRKQFSLTQLGFSLNVAPLIIMSNINVV